MHPMAPAGDRIRGIMFLVRLAAASKRVLLIFQTYPLRFEEVGTRLSGLCVTSARAGEACSRA